MTIIEALENALTLLEAKGYQGGGDIHDDLDEAIVVLRSKYPKAAREELQLERE